jgi:hypothetical protein
VDYKVYVLDSAGRVSSPPKIIECDDDTEALKQAQQYLSSTPVEIWQGSNLIARLAPKE